nr:MAG TPA: hypothetical protein [Caudoviricetes sp.]DAI80223.1 MAG TPA: hypothetical protein [Bacteriophage sp.]
MGDFIVIGWTRGGVGMPCPAFLIKKGLWQR